MCKPSKAVKDYKELVKIIKKNIVVFSYVYLKVKSLITTKER